MPVVALVGGTLGGEPIRIDVGCDRASTDLTRSCNLQRPRGILLGCLIGFLIPWLMVLVYLVEVEGHGKTPPTFRLSDIFGTPFVVGLSAVAKEADHAL